MTNLEAIYAAIGIPGASDGSVTKALLDNGLNAAETYIPNDANVDRAALQVLKQMLGLQSLSEGDYSVTYAIKDRIQQIEDDLGLGSGAKIRNKSYMW